MYKDNSGTEARLVIGLPVFLVDNPRLQFQLVSFIADIEPNTPMGKELPSGLKIVQADTFRRDSDDTDEPLKYRCIAGVLVLN